MLRLEVIGWEGWFFDDQGYLLDPAGNKYLPRDLQAAWWARQAWQERAGYPGQLRFLHEHLRQLIKTAQSSGYIVKVEKQTASGLLLVQSLTLK